MSSLKRVSSNIESIKNNNYSLKLSRWFLISIGAWPQTRTSTVGEKLSAIVLIPVCSVVVAIITIPCLLYVSFEAQDIPSKLNAIGPLIHRIMGSVNYWTLLSRSGDIRNCIHHMEADWKLVRKTDNRELMLHYAKSGRFIAAMCAVFMQGGAFLFSIAKAMKTVTVVIDNKTVTMYPMTCPLYQKFIDTRFSPANEIMLVVQFMSTYVTSASTVCICSLAAVFAMHACGQLNVLYVWLNELTEKNNEGNLPEQKLANIVEHHLRVLSFITRVESIMHKACLAELMGCTINMCLLGYYALMNWAAFDVAKIMSYVLVYLSMGFNIFIFCYISEVLTEQCKNVGEMAYMTNWYKLRHRTALGLILIIARSSNVIKITAGKLFNLSITTFGDVVKTSVVYLNILRTMAM
ncbi:odorant receptor 82a-like [Odontomachus brunneus]|uniref:odorant receptor 82a-like n=1 Tax=Odontomachus brunneus TaxID=486640 RepID=UPI0013F270D7|nr:odorant receptor 82a-like [Odontomachus brunneus]